MSRIFLSHSNAEALQAIALKKWFVKQNPPLDNDIFLDVDTKSGMPLGIKWQDALRQASGRCEAVICLLSDNWEKSTECTTEYRTADNLGKRIIPARLEPGAGKGITRDYQWVDLFGDNGPQETIEITHEGTAHRVTFPVKGLRQLRDEIIDNGIAAETFVWPPPNDPGRAPFRGWEPLQEIDAAVFFGRDAQLVRGLDALRGMRHSGSTLFVILGPSGAGKSSFLRAGLMPRLRREDRSFVVLDVVRPESHVLTGENGLAVSLRAAADAFGLRGIKLADVKDACLNDAQRVHSLLNDIQRAATQRLLEVNEGIDPPTLLLPVDQAEELFGVDGGDQAGRFLELIGEHARANVGKRVPMIVAMTIRTDHHEALQTAPQLQGVLSEVFGDLRPMPPAEFKEVIDGPARRAGDGGRRLSVEPALVERLLSECDLGADTLPLLSLTLARLYKEYGDDGDLLLSDYQKMGEMRRVVQNEVDGLLSQDPGQRAEELKLLREAFIPKLATINPENDQPVRRVAKWDDLPSTAIPLLERFVAKRLLVTGGSGKVVEVALEGFLQYWNELRAWLEEERGSLKQAEVLKRDASEWEKNARNDAWLYEGQQLTDAEALLTSRFQDDISATRDFVEASRRRERAVQRRSRTMRAVMAATVVALLVAAFAGYQLYNSFKRDRGLQLVTQAEQMLDGGRAGGDMRAMQQLLAAESLGARTAADVANSRRDLVRIMENPPSAGGGVTSVHAIAVSPDGKRIVAASDDHVARVWDFDNGAPGPILDVGGERPVLSVAFSPDGSLIATGSDDGSLQLWDASSGAAQGEPMRSTGLVSSVAFSPDGELIATGGGDGRVRIWGIATRNAIVDEPAVERGAVRVVAFRPEVVVITSDSRQTVESRDVVVSGGDDGAVRLWEPRTGRPLGAPQVIHGNTVTSLAFNLSGRSGQVARIAVGLIDGTVQLLNGDNLELIGERFTAHPGYVNSIGFSPGGTRIVTGGSDNTIRVWDVLTQREIGAPLVGHHGSVSSVSFNPDATRIVSGGLDGSVRVWDAVSGLPIPAQQGAEVRSVAFNPNQEEMASGGSDGTVMLWNPGTAAPLRRLGEPSDQDLRHTVNSLAYAPDGSRIVTGGTDGVVRLWDLTRLGEDKIVRFSDVSNSEVHVAKSRIRSVAFSPDGSTIATGEAREPADGMNGAIRLWDGHSLAPKGAVATPYQVWSVAFSPKGNRLVSGSGFDPGGSEMNLIQQWNLEPLAKHGDPIAGPSGTNVYSVSFDSDGTRIASGSNDGTIRLWDAQSRKPIGDPMSGDQNTVMSVVFAQHNPWIVSGAADGKVRLWNSADQSPIGTPIQAHSSWVQSVALSSGQDEKWIVSAGADGTLHLWPAPQDMAGMICAKLNANMTGKQWDDWVSPVIRKMKMCPGLPGL